MKKGILFNFSIWWQYAIVVLSAFFFGFPVIWMVYSSLKTNAELLNNIWGLPAHPTLRAYALVLAVPELKTYFLNSIITTIISVALLTSIASMAAYVLARTRIPGGKSIFYIFLAGMMIPVHVTLIPLYTMMRDIGWLNTLPALIFPYVGFGLPVSIYILKGFFEQIPKEIEEAAVIDGASTARVFWSVILPLSRPALVTVVILNSVYAWNEYLFALTFLSGNDQSFTFPLGVLSIIRSFDMFQYDKALSALTLATLPVLLLFFLLQRQIIQSFVAGSLKV